VKAPYVPEMRDPTDTSHFDKTQTGMPVYSPTLEEGTASTKELSSLYAQGDSSFDEFDEFHFSP